MYLFQPAAAAAAEWQCKSIVDQHRLFLILQGLISIDPNALVSMKDILETHVILLRALFVVTVL